MLRNSLYIRRASFFAPSLSPASIASDHAINGELLHLRNLVFAQKPLCHRVLLPPAISLSFAEARVPSQARREPGTRLQPSASRKASTARPPRIVRTPCSQFHFRISARVLAFASANAVAISA